MGRVTGLVLVLNLVANIQPAMAGVIQLMEENDGGGDLVFVKDDMDEDDDNLKDYDNTNDEARSVRLRFVQPGTVIKVYDSPEGSYDDDVTTIVVKRADWDYVIDSFEESYEDEYVKVNYQEDSGWFANGLDGKVSRIEVDNLGAGPMLDDDFWMAQHWGIIKDKTLSEITLPASHDSGTAGISLSGVAETQYMDIEGQLLDGIRYFDLRVTQDGGRLKIHHGPAVGMSFTRTLTHIGQFLQQREADGHQELVVLSIVPDGDELVGSIEANVSRYLGRWLYKRGDVPGNKDDFHRTQPLRNILSSGPRAIVMIPSAAVNKELFWDKNTIVYDEYANTPYLGRMIQDQTSKYLNFNQNKLFLLSWTLTMPSDAGFVTTLINNLDIEDAPLHGLATQATLSLPDVLEGNTFEPRSNRRVNLLYTDFTGEASTIEIALAMNGYWGNDDNWDYETIDDFYARFWWGQMTDETRQKWQTLGWNQAFWDNGTAEPASASKRWEQLSGPERDAALWLGYNQISWSLE